MKVLVTGCAGFIGFHLTRALLQLGYEVTGIDNINDYYDVELKYDRLGELGISRANIGTVAFSSNLKYPNLKFCKMDLIDQTAIFSLFENSNFDLVCHLAAQAGVRYSITQPQRYIDSNIVGFFNILEASRKSAVGHLVYASSSSVYGLGTVLPFSTGENTDQPASLYAATKKCNELMAHSYSHVFGLPTTGLRFFTVYGPWGRPDMAMYLFTKAISEQRPIQVFNQGNMKRDFTYIDDIVDGIIKVIEKAAREGSNTMLKGKTAIPYHVYNIGRGKSIPLEEFITEIEKQLGVAAMRELMPMQAGDIAETWSDIDEMRNDFRYQPHIDVATGVKHFVDWYSVYYAKEKIEKELSVLNESLSQ
jgi:UDP-glucuronate 4-epimerase